MVNDLWKVNVKVKVKMKVKIKVKGHCEGNVKIMARS